MDNRQSAHLKAYGLAYHALSLGEKGKWLLNYRGGSFLFSDRSEISVKALEYGVAFTLITAAEEAVIQAEIADKNMESLHLEKAPRVAVYTPESAKPWDDAVTLALDFAKIPYDKIYDQDILGGRLASYDWLHLHHEDFTGQYSRFYSAFRNAPWYQESVFQAVKLAEKLGFSSVADEKKAVAEKISKFVRNGGLLFAMCLATESLDIALSACGIDIIPPEIDGSPVTDSCNKKLDFSRCFAFENFTVSTSASQGFLSNIDFNHANTPERVMARPVKLFEFSAKFDPVPTLLTQCHERVVQGFFGLTTSFNARVLKPEVLVLGRVDDNCIQYIYGRHGEGSFTFLGGHDPEDYSHAVYDKPTDLSKHPDSPGYRLILNNVLYPAAEKKKLKT